MKEIKPKGNPFNRLNDRSFILMSPTTSFRIGRMNWIHCFSSIIISWPWMRFINITSSFPQPPPPPPPPPAPPQQIHTHTHTHIYIYIFIYSLENYGNGLLMARVNGARETDSGRVYWPVAGRWRHGVTNGRSVSVWRMWSRWVTWPASRSWRWTATRWLSTRITSCTR